MKAFPGSLQHGSGATMTLEPQRLLLAMREPTSPEAMQARLAQLGLTLEDADDHLEKHREPFAAVNHTDRRYWIRARDDRRIDRDRLEAIRRGFGASLEWIGPVYRLGQGTGRGNLVCPFPDVVLVRFTPRVDEHALGRAEASLRRLLAREHAEKSKYLGDFRYWVLDDPWDHPSWEVQRELRVAEKSSVRDVHFEIMPMLVPITATSNDPLLGQQWSMARIAASGPGMTGWDISTGDASVVVAVIDSGCDLTHPDLAFAGNGINLGTMAGTGAPVGPVGVIGHGTCCAGLVAATFDNGAGVAGVAGTCRVLPIAFQNWTDAECAAGITWAAMNGASVLSMSFGVYAPGDGFSPVGWNFAFIDPAIADAVNLRGCVLVAATGNEDTGVVNRYPSRHALVMAVGGSDQADARKSFASADGECWGANFGPGISVVAPCVLNPTTDIRAAQGYNVNNGGSLQGACVNYPVCGDAAGDYFFQFNGTSSATPHVAGLAGAIRGEYPGLTNLQVRRVIERTAEKVGGTYADAPGFTNGRRNAQMGYGRINMLRALDFADAAIRDWPGDDGAEPSSPPGGNFWTFADVVVRIQDDGVFDPGDPAKSSNVERGQTNYIYVTVTNNGPRDARNVVVAVRITPYVGLEFAYPTDWTASDAMHVSPTPVTATFASVPVGSSVIAKFEISSAQVESLWGWISGSSWHPCLLAAVTADNDYAFATATTGGGGLIVRRNNLAQRNLSMIDVLAGASVAFPFVAGHRQNSERLLELVVDRRRLPREMPLLLALDADPSPFPRVDFARPDADEHCDGDIVFVERTRIATTFGCCEGIFTLEAGSRFRCPPKPMVGDATVEGGEIVVRGRRRFAEIRDDVGIVRIDKLPGATLPLAVHATIPRMARSDDAFWIVVAQRNAAGSVVGGATAIYTVR